MEVYVPGPEKMVHTTSIDFGKRIVPRTVNLVQYDAGLPVIAVSLFFNEVPLVLTETAEMNLRFYKVKDHTFLYNPALGCNEERTVVYFGVTEQMTVLRGTYKPIVELMVGDDVAGSGYIDMEIERNPVQNLDIVSSNEFILLRTFSENAEASELAASGFASQAEAAKSIAESEADVATEQAVMAAQSVIGAGLQATDAAGSAVSANTYKNAAKASQDAAKASQDAAKASQDASKASEDAAKISETNAGLQADRSTQQANAAKASQDASKASEDAAKISETNAGGHEDDALISKNAAKASQDAAKTSEDNAKASENAAKTSEDNADISEGNALTSANKSESYAVGNTGTREGENIDNSKYYKEVVAQAMADLLHMLGNSVATLDETGHLTPAQIPALSINTVTDVADTDAMLLLAAERGDVALIVVESIVTESYILAADDPTILANWKKLGVSYVANAGHASTADNATNSETINNKRIIDMTQAQYDVAVLDPDTYYIVTP